MSSNYPPGVTGNEYAIGGAESEWEAEETCPNCGWAGVMTHEAHHELGVWVWCANPDLNDDGEPCINVTFGFGIDPDEPDPDEAYDRARDDALTGDAHER